MGTKRFVALCERLAAKHGPRFAPSRLLSDMAARNEAFYGRFTPGRSGKAA
jgi:3-hydroxyacyl-CoA dehydrogenase/enoyl-CoA hydratase/3-hydroxybutyryl-CoA epimerase